MVFSGLGFGSSACAGWVLRPENTTSDKSAINKRKVPQRGMGVLRQAVVVVNPLPCFDWPLGLVVSRVARLLDRLRMSLYACVSGRKEGEGQLCRNRDGAIQANPHRSNLSRLIEKASEG